MALRNYLYAKHQNDIETTTRINKAQDSISIMTSETSHSNSNIDKEASSIPRYANRANRIKVHYKRSNGVMVDRITKNVEQLDIHKDEKSHDECKKECESCKCKREDSTDSDTVMSEDKSVDDAPLIQVEIGTENEIDFTDKMI